MNQVVEICKQLVSDIEKTQQANILRAAKVISEAYSKGNKVFVTGSGHSHTFAEELYGRAGGLAFFVPILTTELTIVEHPTKSTYLERLPGYAAILVELYGLKQKDVVIIASNSGRNAYPIEMALESKSKGCHVIAVTNIKHSLSTEPRHNSKKRLMDVADVVIDNCGEIGDAVVSLKSLSEKIVPTSSISNAIIAQMLNYEIVEDLLEKGIEPPIFTSANVDGGFEKNQELMKKYTRLY